MHVHSSRCLPGPLTAARPWWRQPEHHSSAGARRPDEVPMAPRQDDDPEFRADLVARIRREIAEGNYGTEEQLQQALEKLFGELDSGRAPE